MCIIITATTCPQESYPTNLLNQPTSVNPTSSIQFENMLTINCDVPGKTAFTKERKCIYDMTLNNYHLYGNTYECGGLYF